MIDPLPGMADAIIRLERRVQDLEQGIEWIVKPMIVRFHSIQHPSADRLINIYQCPLPPCQQYVQIFESGDENG